MNLANLTQEEKDKINVDLAVSGVAYKERLNMPVVASEVERQQPAHLIAFHVRCKRPKFYINCYCDTLTMKCVYFYVINEKIKQMQMLKSFLFVTLVRILP